MAMFTRSGKAMEHEERWGAKGAGRVDLEVDDTTRGGKGWTTQGKRVADDTTKGLLLRRQKMVEPAHSGVCLHQCCCASVAIAPGEGGAGTYCCQSQGAIDNNC
jgi:hypothetical protein